MANENENTVTEDVDQQIEAELAAFEAEESKRLGLHREQYTEHVHRHFVASQRATTTIMVSGLTFAHDKLVAAALRGIGYQVIDLPCPDTAALQIGKEFGNRGQCNPTYFTVGNLVKVLQELRDNDGMSVPDIIEHYVFVTAGACGPCRFGTYVTEYRKALRDAGFDGFRVLLFQQQGGLKQATGEEMGLKIDATFGQSLVRAMIAGDVLNMLAYRLRPYEVVPGSTNAAMDQSREILAAAFEAKANIVLAMWRCRKIMAEVAVDRSVPKPLVSIIGEFWAMTTEGDGNYHLQRFLEEEGAEVDIQPITNWILFMVWENTFDTEQRIDLKQADGGKKGLEGKDPTKKLWILGGADKVVRMLFHSYAEAIGLHGVTLPDMGEIADLAKEHYDNFVRGGEAHMEVGKVIHFVKDRLNHMTVSVKPFGCMPSSGVSDGIQSVIQTRWPEAIFQPVETTGDGAVNVYSRLQMMLFKARQKAREEYEAALAETGMDEARFKAKLAKSRKYKGPFGRPPHRMAGVTTNLVYALG